MANAQYDFPENAHDSGEFGDGFLKFAYESCDPKIRAVKTERGYVSAYLNQMPHAQVNCGYLRDADIEQNSAYSAQALGIYPVGVGIEQLKQAQIQSSPDTFVGKPVSMTLEGEDVYPYQDIMAQKQMRDTLLASAPLDTSIAMVGKIEKLPEPKPLDNEQAEMGDHDNWYSTFAAGLALSRTDSVGINTIKATIDSSSSPSLSYVQGYRAYVGNPLFDYMNLEVEANYATISGDSNNSAITSYDEKTMIGFVNARAEKKISDRLTMSLGGGIGLGRRSVEVNSSLGNASKSKMSLAAQGIANLKWYYTKDFSVDLGYKYQYIPGFKKNDGSLIIDSDNAKNSIVTLGFSYYF